MSQNAFFKRASARVWRYLPAAGCVCVLALMLARALGDPQLCWDPWDYHMPFAALLWNIGEARQQVFYDVVYRRFQGFGMTGYWLMGLIWKVLGSPNFFPLVNLIPWAVMLGLARRWLGVPLPMLVFAMLIMPLIAIHTSVVYIDLYLGSLLGIAWLGMVRLLQAPSLRFADRRDFFGARLALLLGMGLAGNAKFSALSVILSFVAYAGLVLLWRAVRRKQALPWAMGLWMAAALTLSFGTAIKNQILHQNPFYPMGFTLPWKYYQADHDVQWPPSVDYLPTMPEWSYFLLSATEIDWLMRDLHEIRYTESSQLGDHPKRFGPARTGGLFGPYVMVQMLVIAIGAWALYRRGRWTSPLRHGLGLWLALTLMLSFNPQGHELRYWLVWPLVLGMLFAATLAEWVRGKPEALRRVQVALLATLLAVQTLLPLQRTLMPETWLNYFPSGMVKYLDQKVLQNLLARQRTCVYFGVAPVYLHHGARCDVSSMAYSPMFTRMDYRIETTFSPYYCRWYEPY